ncbi:regulatory protein RecX [Gordonia hydrophobica]|uniref:Regulatory protein RecX n=1 Tax=Gordonia hydrophobica TaxID=40516 RepID=A0ABZ2U0K4_9ACTN|nr:regulatory protein RecX [Gordonia hydrophobica]MBM7367675.1 regulatory protein [Gordonia hydrophobica]
MEKPGPSPWDAALRLLGTRARSRAEMRERLEKREFTADEVEHTLRRLDDAGLLDDTEFAEEWVRSRHQFSGRGRVALKRELRTKGIDDETAAVALAQIDPDDERAQAVRLAEKKLNVSGAELADREVRAKAYRRLAGALSRRGFPSDVVGSVVKEVLDSARQ